MIDFTEKYTVNDAGYLVSKRGTIVKHPMVVAMYKGVEYRRSTASIIWEIKTGERWLWNFYRIDRTKDWKFDNIAKKPPQNLTRNRNRELPKNVYQDKRKKKEKYGVIVQLNGKLWDIGHFDTVDQAVQARDYVLSIQKPIKMTGKCKGLEIGKYEEL